MLIQLDGKRFGQRLRSLRRKKWISQKGLADQCGITMYRLRRIEQGLVSELEDSLLRELCSAVDSCVDQMLPPNP